MAAIVPLALGNAWNVGRMAMQALPYITALYGASEGAKEGGLLGALTGGGLGYLGGRVGKGYVSKGAKAAEKAAPGLTSRALGLKPGEKLKPGISNIAQAAGYAAVPLAAAGLAAPLVGRLAGQTGNFVGQAAAPLTSAAGALTGGVLRSGQGNPPSGDPYAQPVPTAFSVNPQTGLIEVMNPLSPRQAELALEQQRYAMNREELMKTLPIIEKATEERSKAEMLRQAAMANLRNELAIQQRAAAQAQLGAQQMAQTGLQGAIGGITKQYQYG